MKGFYRKKDVAGKLLVKEKRGLGLVQDIFFSKGEETSTSFIMQIALLLMGVRENGGGPHCRLSH